MLKFLCISLISFCAICSPAQKAKSANPAHRITAAQAQKAALRKYTGKVVGKVALENEDGSWQYSVNVRSGKVLREVMVDAKSGKIASVEVTSAKEEARENAAEKKHSKKHPA